VGPTAGLDGVKKRTKIFTEHISCRSLYDQIHKLHIMQVNYIVVLLRGNSHFPVFTFIFNSSFPSLLRSLRKNYVHIFLTGGATFFSFIKEMPLLECHQEPNSKENYSLRGEK
jgi:hypothetical protein